MHFFIHKFLNNPISFAFADSLTSSQFPVFTMYATKLCINNAEVECSFIRPASRKLKKKKLPNAAQTPRRDMAINSSLNVIKRSWSFDRVHHHQLVGFVRKRIRVNNGRYECMELCLTERQFTCRHVQ